MFCSIILCARLLFCSFQSVGHGPEHAPSSPQGFAGVVQLGHLGWGYSERAAWEESFFSAWELKHSFLDCLSCFSACWEKLLTWLRPTLISQFEFGPTWTLCTCLSIYRLLTDTCHHPYAGLSFLVGFCGDCAHRIHRITQNCEGLICFASADSLVQDSCPGLDQVAHLDFECLPGPWYGAWELTGGSYPKQHGM